MSRSRGTPPGRSARLWLLRRLQAGNSAADVLDRKLRLLQLELDRWQHDLAAAQRTWEDACRQAEVWWLRACLESGQRGTTPLAPTPACSVEVSDAATLGLRFPAAAQCRFSDGDTVADVTTMVSARAYQEAVAAAADAGVAARAVARLSAETAVTRRRLRALRTRVLPDLHATLTTVQLELDELEREDNARLRRIAGADVNRR